MPRQFRFDRLWFLSVSAAAMLFLLGCAADGRNTTMRPVAPDPGILRVGVTPKAPPLIYRQNDRIVGLEADFARALAEYLGRSLRFVELEWDDQITALLENRIDMIMSGMSITTLREFRIAFCIPYLRSGQMALIRREDTARFSTGLFTLSSNSSIGVIKNTTGEYFVEQSFVGIKKEVFSEPPAAARALIDKRIDVFIYDGPVVLYLASENEDKGLTALPTLMTVERFAWGVRKDNPQLLESANDFLRSRNEEGTLNQMIKFWIPLAR